MNFTDYDKEVVSKIWNLLMDPLDDKKLSEETADVIELLHRITEDHFNDMIEEELGI